MELIDREFVRRALPARPADGHKGTFGKVCLLGGSVGYTGAPVLCAGAAVRSGCGLVYLGVPECVWQIAAAKCLCAMPFPLPEKDGALALSGEADFRRRAEGCDAVAIGCGMGRSADSDALTRRLLTLPQPLVLEPGQSLRLGQGGVPCPAALVHAARPGQNLLLDDGRLLVQVAEADGAALQCTVVRGGTLQSRKSLAAPGLAVFSALAWRYNALLSGDAAAGSMGVNVSRLRFFSLLLASLMTAACVSSLGIIGFVGIICPHVAKRLLGQDHRVSIPASALLGSLLLLCADALSRSLGSGSALPVGAITSLLGAPFFLTIIFSRKEHGQC